MYFSSVKLGLCEDRYRACAVLLDLPLSLVNSCWLTKLFIFDHCLHQKFDSVSRFKHAAKANQSCLGCCTSFSFCATNLFLY